MNALIEKYKKHPSCMEMLELLQDKNIRKINPRGLAGSSRSLLAATVISSQGGTHLLVTPEKDDAAYLYADLVNLLGENNIYFFPSSYKKSVHYNQVDNGNIILRTNLLNRLTSAMKDGSAEPYLIIVGDAEGLAEKVVSGNDLKNSTFQIIKGEKISSGFLREVLDEYQFQLVDFVYEPGQYSIRGSIVDIFSYSNPAPFRVDFFGDEVESIRSFDIESQLSVRQFDSITLVPDLTEIETHEAREPLLEYLDPSTVIWSDNTAYIQERMDAIHNEENAAILNEDGTPVDKSVFTGGAYFLEKSQTYRQVQFGSGKDATGAQIGFQTRPQPAFNKNFNLLADTLMQQLDEGFEIYILSDNPKQMERLTSIFHDINGNLHFTPVMGSLHEGFSDSTLAFSCYTDHQIFERHHRYAINNYFNNKASLTLKELGGLKPGDYVVHIDHGIGVFGGLETIDISGKQQESIRLIYKDQDMLYVSIHALHRVSKYKGRENDVPRLHKLGSGSWQKLKSNTKSKIKDIARELISLYARRKMNDGFAFSADSYLQTELEASFVYEDTPDQLKATVAVKDDMESTNPMDRLVCGDVGFGKTEVAIRAAFKAVADSKQVALLVPTTILALQHFNTFSERLKDFPCNLEYINRFKKGSQQSEILKRLESGTIDIIIGTHRLLGSDVKFRDLGLLVIDEEQKFGVSAKEKLRNLRANVDTLTLTATPIPRTMQFSLMGIRDLSVINTPPPNRHPIVTELHPFNEEIIRSGIEYELSRGGQVFFIHNRVQNIEEVASLIHKVSPDVSVCIAHGQMQGKELEKNMLEFIRGDFDVLVATAIIESGLDIPNANTIFINNAHHFGLSDLHQLRGRVGRSNKKAYCYLLAPAPSLLTPEARRRLKAIEDFSELGSGFNIALQDLDIRGAGNMLGAEQSGFIADVGFETYHLILNEAILELQESEFPGLTIHANENTSATRNYSEDCQIDTDMELLFPEKYIASTSERMYLYRELDRIRTEDQLQDFEKQLIDRFGALPESASELLKVVRLRWNALALGMEKLILKNGKMIGYFIANPESSFYKSEIFSSMIQAVQKMPRFFRLKEAKQKLTLTCEPVNSVQQAIDTLSKLLPV